MTVVNLNINQSKDIYFDKFLRFIKINIMHVIRNLFYYPIKFNKLTESQKPNLLGLGFLRELDHSTLNI